ncbi:hypothetical protein [Caulobacter sp. X]|uniref:hypothetical protein n=1 Tax=Caulobacter sp. X TaxID=2048901 RepID=UPI00117772AE|nr:hypothetical protein [Caulobacter sp. X]
MKTSSSPKLIVTTVFLASSLIATSASAMAYATAEQGAIATTAKARISYENDRPYALSNHHPGLLRSIFSFLFGHERYRPRNQGEYRYALNSGMEHQFRGARKFDYGKWSGMKKQAATGVISQYAPARKYLTSAKAAASGINPTEGYLLQKKGAYPHVVNFGMEHQFKGVRELGYGKFAVMKEQTANLGLAGFQKMRVNRFGATGIGRLATHLSGCHTGIFGNRIGRTLVK